MCSYCCSWISNILSALQCFDSVGWAAGRAPGLQKTEWWGAGVIICLERGADLLLAQPGVKLGGSRRISDPAPLIWDPLPLITDPIPHNWDPAPFCWDTPLCWVESKHQTLLKCHKSQTECLECSKTPAIDPSGSSFGRSSLAPTGIHHFLLSNLTTGPSWCHCHSLSLASVKSRLVLPF